jgi:hypothetical protein
VKLLLLLLLLLLLNGSQHAHHARKRCTWMHLLSRAYCQQVLYLQHPLLNARHAYNITLVGHLHHHQPITSETQVAVAHHGRQWGRRQHPGSIQQLQSPRLDRLCQLAVPIPLQQRKSDSSIQHTAAGRMLLRLV